MNSYSLTSYEEAYDDVAKLEELRKTGKKSTKSTKTRLFSLKEKSLDMDLQQSIEEVNKFLFSAVSHEIPTIGEMLISPRNNLNENSKQVSFCNNFPNEKQVDTCLIYSPCLNSLNFDVSLKCITSLLPSIKIKRNTKGNKIISNLFQVQCFTVSTATIRVIKMSTCGFYLAVGCSDGALYFYNISSNKYIKQLTDQADVEKMLSFFDQNSFSKFKEHTSDIISLSWSTKDVHLCASASLDNFVVIYDVEKKVVLSRLPHFSEVIAVSFIDEKYELLASSAIDKTIRIWNYRNQEIVDSIQRTDYITAIAEYPEGGKLLLGNNTGKVFSFDFKVLA